VIARDSGTAVMICKSDFPARQSACDRIAPHLKDIVPSEMMLCSKAVSPSDLASLLTRGSKAGWTSLDFSSEGALVQSLEYLPVMASPLYISYGDCNSARSLPDLEASKRYVAVVLLDNEAAQGSRALNQVTGDTFTRLEIESTIKFYDTNLLTDSDFRSQLADQLLKCQGSLNYCSLQFNSLVISKEASIVMDSYL
jgi:hypothetical protein